MAAICYLIKTLINPSNGFNASKFVVFTPSLTDSTPGIGCYNTDMSITKSTSNNSLLVSFILSYFKNNHS